MQPIIPIDVAAISRRALRGYGPQDPEPLPEKPRRLGRLRGRAARLSRPDRAVRAPRVSVSRSR